MSNVVRVTGLKDVRLSIEDLPDDEVLATMLSVEHEVVDASPVDTKRFQSSWVAGIDYISNEVVGTDLEQSRVGSAHYSRPSSFTGARVWGNDPAQIKGRSLSLANSIPYAKFLAEGWSPQAPNGWIDSAIRRGIAGRDRFRKGLK